MQIFVQAVKKIKGIPTLVKKEHKFKGDLIPAIEKLKSKHTTYFEVVDQEQNTKVVYTKKTGEKNYKKKQFKVLKK